VVRVAVDVPALADQGREFDYLAPAGMPVEVGALVRVSLAGRRVGGWIVATDVEPPAGIRLAPVAKLTGLGPPADVVELTAWAAWRWAGRRTALLRAASPPGAVTRLPERRPGTPRPGPGSGAGSGEGAQLAREALAAGEAVVRVPPAFDLAALVAGLIAAGGPALVVTPAVELAHRLARGLQREGMAVAVVPEGWPRAAAGGTTVIGARAAAWAPAPDVAAVVVLDAHDAALTEERAPSWSAWVVAAERARRRGVPCVLVSPCPLLEQLRWGQLVLPARTTERAGWAPLEILDRRHEDPRAGLLGERLVPILRQASLGRRVVCVLNRKGRVRLLACRVCGALTVCEHCGGAMAQPGAGAGGAMTLRCQRCARERPAVCQACGSGALRAARTGVTKLAEDLEALARLPVGVVTAEVAELPPTPVLAGTEAVLHRVGAAGVGVGAVVFVEFDGELSAPRYRAPEEALAELARASRVVGGRGGGRVLVQTRQPDHPVLQAALRADPGRLAELELAVRQELGLPPVTALAELSGDPGTTAGVAAALTAHGGLEVIGPTDGHWLVRARDHRILCDALAEVGRPVGAGNDMLRIEVDPQRV